MPINFPNTPTVGQTFTYGGRSWTFTGLGWASNGSTGTEGPPGPPGADGAAGPPGSGAEKDFVPPTISTFTTQRANTGAIENISGDRGVRIRYTPPSGDVNNCIYAAQAITKGSAGWEAIARIRFQGWVGDYLALGIGVRDSVSGKSEFVGFGANFATKRIYFSNDTTYAGGGTAGIGNPSTNNIWIKVKEAADTRYFYWSFDGDFWFLNYSQTVSASAYVTDATHVGIFINPNYGGFGGGQGQEIALDVLSWEQNGIGIVGAVNKRFWRLNVEVPEGGVFDTVQIEALEMYGTVGGPNLLTGGTVTESSHTNSNDAAGMVAGLYPWTAAFTWPQWVAYEFPVGTTPSIVSVKIKGSSGFVSRSPKTFHIQFSDDGTTWTTYWSVYNTPWWGVGEVRIFNR